MLEHCQKKGDEAHQELASDDFSKFHDRYRKLIGWTGVSNDLHLPPSRSDCFALDYFIHMMTINAPFDNSKLYSLLLQIAERSGMEYLCPSCVQPISSKRLLPAHYDTNANGNQTHASLASAEAFVFIPAYQRVMGHQIEDLPLGFDRKGPRSFHECFKSRFVLGNKDIGLLVNWLDKNLTDDIRKAIEKYWT